MGKSAVDSSFDSALKFPLHPLSLILIFAYLLMKTFYEGFSDNNLRDEAIGGECSCKSNDRNFYQLMYWFHCAVWWIGVIAVFIIHIVCR